MTLRAAAARLARGARRIGRAARDRRVLPFVAGGVLVAVAVAVAVGTGEPRGPGAATLPVVRVGVSDGASVPAYAVEQQAELARLVREAPGTPVYALVSLRAYTDPGQVGPITKDAATIAAYARVPLPGRQTELVRLPAARVPDDLLAGMRDAAGRKAAQAASYRTAGPDREALAAVAEQEAAAYRAGCSCVYALVVRATPVVLTALAAREGVRVVDAAPDLPDVAYGVFVAPLPEQVDTVGPLPQAEG